MIMIRKNKWVTKIILKKEMYDTEILLGCNRYSNCLHKNLGLHVYSNGEEIMKLRKKSRMHVSLLSMFSSPEHKVVKLCRIIFITYVTIPERNLHICCDWNRVGYSSVIESHLSTQCKLGSILKKLLKFEIFNASTYIIHFSLEIQMALKSCLIYWRWFDFLNSKTLWQSYRLVPNIKELVTLYDIRTA
jgi:hypothetical protein